MCSIWNLGDSQLAVHSKSEDEDGRRRPKDTQKRENKIYTEKEWILQSNSREKRYWDSQRKFDELTDAWSTVERKHDIYLMYLNEEEITANEKWIEELQEEYNEASTVYIKYDNERKALELKEQEELNRQHIITLREEEFQRIVQQTIMKKKIHGSNLWIFNWTC